MIPLHAEAAVMKFGEHLLGTNSTVARIRAVIVPSAGMRTSTFSRYDSKPNFR
jgi:hypothetical protein